MDHVLRHSTSAGGSDVNRWDLSDDNKILASILVASGPLVHVAISVASIRSRVRMRGEYAMWCISTGADAWRIEHGVYDAHLDPPHPLLPAISLVLLNAPELVGLRLAELVGTEYAHNVYV